MLGRKAGEADARLPGRGRFSHAPRLDGERINQGQVEGFLLVCLGMAIKQRNDAVVAVACGGICYLALYALMPVGASYASTSGHCSSSVRSA